MAMDDIFAGRAALNADERNIPFLRLPGSSSSSHIVAANSMLPHPGSYLMNGNFVHERHQTRCAWSDGEPSPLNMDVRCIRRLENAASDRVCDTVSFDLGFVQE
jgi:hypothetical protein